METFYTSGRGSFSELLETAFSSPSMSYSYIIALTLILIPPWINIVLLYLLSESVNPEIRI